MRVLRYLGNILTYAGRILPIPEHIYNEGEYWKRVVAAGGTVADREMVEDIYKIYEENNMLDNIRVGVLAQAGGVQRTSGIYRFFSKLFTLRTDANDVTQSTANSQPYFVNGALVNPNGGSRFMTHPTVSFADNEAWSVSVVFRIDGGAGLSAITGKTDGYTSNIAITKSDGIYGVRVRLDNSTQVQYQISNRILHNKKICITVTYNNGSISIYNNATLLGTSALSGGFIAEQVLGYVRNIIETSYKSVYCYILRSGALTPSQITAEYTVLRKYFPEIRTTLIGSKEIATENCQMVATPMGRVISLNNTAGNVERIPQPLNFLSGWIPADALVNDSNTFTTNISGGVYLITGIVSGVYYKARISGSTTATSLAIRNPNDATIYRTVSGTFDLTFYFQSTAPGIFLRNFGAGATNIAFFSLEQVNWIGASDLYTAIYNQTVGTVAQKTSAALAAAAMWRSPDADHDKQAVFGKVFNKFATKLMAFDIAAYNAANPSTPWGYHVMTRAESLALQALDADTLKATGTDYWTTANGTNTTGLNLLGSGVINADGTYSDFKGKTRLMTDDDYAIDINDDGTATEISVTTEGGILRLVKD